MSFLEQTQTDDAPEADVEQALRAYYEREYERFGDAPATDALRAWLAPAIEAARQDETSPGLPVPFPRWRWSRASAAQRRRARRVGLLPALVAAALVMGAAAFVAAPLVSQMLGDPGAHAVHDQHLGRDVHLAETFAGQTMTIAWIYADANRIVVAYTVQASSGPAPDCFPFGLHAALLTDDAGREYLPNGGGAALPFPQPAPSECELSFDAAALAGNPPTTVHMHLALWPPCVGEPVFPAFPLPSDPRGVAAQCPKPASPPKAEAEAHAGPPAFAFDLAIPFYGGTVVTVGQTLTADGKTVTLERVVVAPSETRLYVHGIDPQIGLAPSSPPKVSSVTVDGKTAFPSIAGADAGAGFEVVNCEQSGGCGRTSLDVVYHLLAPGVAVHGQWVVTFRSDEPQMPGDKSPPPTWTFRFQV